MVLIITYDLRTPKDYHDFYEAIKLQGEQGKWWHYMTSTWLLSTTKTPQQVFDAIHPHLDNQDFLLVCELSPNYQGWLPKQAWDWINAELGISNLYGGIFGHPTPVAPIPGYVPPGVVPPGLPPPPRFQKPETLAETIERIAKSKKPGGR
jgi:hypothetical protein